MNASVAPAIVTRDIRKLYGDLAAVDGVSLEIAPGKVFALLEAQLIPHPSSLEAAEGGAPFSLLPSVA